MTDQLTHLAQGIAVAEIEAAQADTAVGEAQTRVDKISDRISELGAERAAIVARRARGEHDSEDGPKLALIEADREGLHGMLPGAGAMLQAARARQQVVSAALATAKSAYTHEEARIALAALDTHADALVGLLRDTLSQRQATAAALPPDQRGLQRIISRGQALEAMTLESIVAARAATPKVPYGSRPVSVPNDDFYNEILRLNLNDGRLS